MHFSDICRVGGSQPVVFSYVSEFFTERQRGPIVIILASCWQPGIIYTGMYGHGSSSLGCPWLKMSTVVSRSLGMGVCRYYHISSCQEPTIVIFLQLSYVFSVFFTLLVVPFIKLTWPSNSLACYLPPNHAHFSCCSLIAPTFSVGHFISAKLYCGIINQDSTLVVCSNGRCYFTSNTAV